MVVAATAAMINFFMDGTSVVSDSGEECCRLRLFRSRFRGG
jgi:hypothetical protein